MIKDYVPYELAKELKELGFNEHCLAWWFKNISVPTQTRGFWGNWNAYESGLRTSAPFFFQAFRWFRNVHQLIAVPHYTGGDFKHYDIIVHDNRTGDEIENVPYSCDTYEIAEEECLKFLIEMLKERNESQVELSIINNI